MLVVLSFSRFRSRAGLSISTVVTTSSCATVGVFVGLQSILHLTAACFEVCLNGKCLKSCKQFMPSQTGAYFFQVAVDQHKCGKSLLSIPFIRLRAHVACFAVETCRVDKAG